MSLSWIDSFLNIRAFPEDLSESKDRLKEFPEIEQRLAAMLQKCLEEGRSTPGVRQVNEYEITVPVQKESMKKAR